MYAPFITTGRWIPSDGAGVGKAPTEGCRTGRASPFGWEFGWGRPPTRRPQHRLTATVLP